MARRLPQTSTSLNPEAWVLDPASWGFVMDIWSNEAGVIDFEPSAQSFPISAHALPVDEIGFAVDHEAGGASAPEKDWAQWNFDPEHWGFQAGWAERAGSDS